MKRNLSFVGKGDEGKSLLTATGKVVHKIKSIEDYGAIHVTTYCGRREYPRQRDQRDFLKDAQWGTWYTSQHEWRTPVTCQGCIDGEKAARVEASGHVVRISRRDLGRRWGSTRSSYGRNVECSCGWKTFSNEYAEGAVKLDRWAEDAKRCHFLYVWELERKERDAALHEALQEDAAVDAADDVEQSIDEVLQGLANGDGPYAQAARETLERHYEQGLKGDLERQLDEEFARHHKEVERLIGLLNGLDT